MCVGFATWLVKKRPETVAFKARQSLQVWRSFCRSRWGRAANLPSLPACQGTILKRDVAQNSSKLKGQELNPSF